MVGVSASVNLSLRHKVQKFSSFSGSPGWSWKKGHEMVVMWWCGVKVNEIALLYDFELNILCTLMLNLCLA